MRIVFVGLLALAAAGCTPERRAAQQASLEAADDATCRSYGVPKGSEPYVACRMQQAQLRAQEDAQYRAQGMQMMHMGTGMMYGQ